MKERPILFQGAMVRAILDGTKTQTRRVVKVRGEQPPAWATFAQEGSSLRTDGSARRCGLFYWSEEQAATGPLKTLRRWPLLPPKHPMAGDHYWTQCPYGKPGDRLWVRETFVCDDYRYPTGPIEELKEELFYRADDEQPFEAPEGKFWKPSIHMPRWASRITLEITSVRVERLQDISESDAIAEGIEPVGCNWRDYMDHPYNNFTKPRFSYKSLWESINGAGSWDANPWVWVVEFKRIEGANK